MDSVILSFIIAHWLDIAIIAVFIGILLFWIKTANKAKLFSLAKFVVQKAEELYGSNAGQAKKNQAIQMLKEKSFLVRFLLSDEKIDELIQQAWEWLNDELTEKEKEALLNQK